MVNNHNDYEDLASLLYPSIEASGNVYYGQTRKLAIDELFNINDGGFESNIKTIRRQTDSNEDLYLPEGQYVSCTGAVSQQNTTEYVFVLLLRVA